MSNTTGVTSTMECTALTTSREVVRNRAEILMFLGRQISEGRGRDTQISDRIL